MATFEQFHGGKRIPIDFSPSWECAQAVECWPVCTKANVHNERNDWNIYSFGSNMIKSITSLTSPFPCFLGRVINCIIQSDQRPRTYKNLHHLEVLPRTFQQLIVQVTNPFAFRFWFWYGLAIIVVGGLRYRSFINVPPTTTPSTISMIHLTIIHSPFHHHSPPPPPPPPP